MTVLSGGCKQKAKNQGVAQRFPVTNCAKMLHWSPGWKQGFNINSLTQTLISIHLFVLRDWIWNHKTLKFPTWKKKS